MIFQNHILYFCYEFWHYYYGRPWRGCHQDLYDHVLTQKQLYIGKSEEEVAS